MFIFFRSLAAPLAALTVAALVVVLFLALVVRGERYVEQDPKMSSDASSIFIGAVDLALK